MKALFSLLMLLSFSSSQAQISEIGLIGYFPFDGSVLDESTSENDGIGVNVTYGADSQGNPESALFFNGMDSYVNLSSFGEMFKDNLGEMTIYFKMKFVSDQSNQTIISLGNEGEDLSSNVFEFEFENEAIQIETEIGSDAVNNELELDEQESLVTYQWHEVMITIQGNDLVYCRDGEIIYDGEYVPSETTSETMSIGCFDGSGISPCCYFNGYIDDLQFYDRIVEKQEIMISTPEITLFEDLILYPNPTKEKVSIDIPENLNLSQIEIVNMDGKVCDQIVLKNNIRKIKFNMPETTGMYFVKIYQEGLLYQTTPIIKE